MSLGGFSDIDEREDDYWAAVVENEKLRKAVKDGIITETQYELLRNHRTDYGITGNQTPGWGYCDNEDRW